MKRRDFLHLSLAGIAAMGLSGCGFRLRGLGSSGPTLEALALNAADSDLAPVVRESLESAGTRLDVNAALRLNLGQERFREISLTHGDAGSQDTELQLTAPFSVQRAADGAYLLNQQQLDVSTTFSVSDDDLLAQDDIRSEARERLRRDAARQLIERLRPLAER
ncbi:hypothetical protein GCM10007160_20950 [Litchfieldella qijiaojingensis]|uniref:LPS-assembly lipoprotein LptE n=1 Tax=Litchfieldella qijiaojingensis TaxID=980347 RepID=A0ABQ2YUS2_9GAMM|nr:LPS assembly lipoprotein LptE [Halomonas qijiaojingensis]GGX93226.1 hypothetical protein GCM10007160_20950 [Halomonas qijiaojingensis]